MKASTKMVFAHYVPNFSLSLDNKNYESDYYTVDYQDPNGEGGAHKAYGGFVRDRPMARPSLPSSVWRMDDFETEVRQAMAAGINGFVVDIFSFPGNSQSQVAKNVQLLMDAAHDVNKNFRILLMPDMTSGPGTQSPQQLAASVARLGKSPAAYHLPDGRLVVAPFHSETHPANWWSQFLTSLRGEYHTPTAFIPLFLNAMGNLNSFAPISYGLADWGDRDAAGNDPNKTGPGSQTYKINAVHAKGLKWMQPVSVQDERPRDSRFWEAANTQNLRNTWTLAIKDHADIVQMTTWNDYAEGSQFAPSQQHGRAFLDISSYYIAWYKTGHAPKIKRDTIFLTHRIQPWQAKPTYPETKLMHYAGQAAPRDTVEALTFLTAPGTVNINVGGKITHCHVPAGEATCTAPLRTGTVSATVTRHSRLAASVTSPFRVTDTPYTQDLGYYAESNVNTPTPTLASKVELNAPTSAAYGKRVALTGQVTRTDTHVAMGTVTLKRFSHHSVQTLRTVTPANNGMFTFFVKPMAGAKYAVVYSGDDKNKSSYSAKSAMAVAPEITAWGWRHWTHHHVHIVVGGHVSPNMTGHLVHLYEVIGGRNLFEIGQARINSKGGYRIVTRLPVGLPRTLYVGTGATKAYAASFSNAVRLPHHAKKHHHTTKR